MSILVIAEHDNEEIKASTNNVVTAATNLEGIFTFLLPDQIVLEQKIKLQKYPE